VFFPARDGRVGRITNVLTDAGMSTAEVEAEVARIAHAD